MNAISTLLERLQYLGEGAFYGAGNSRVQRAQSYVPEVSSPLINDRMVLPSGRNLYGVMHGECGEDDKTGCAREFEGVKY